MLRTLIAVVVTISFVSLDAAEAASKRKLKKPLPAASATMSAKPVVRTPGPTWAMPGECFTDEGYGRYWPCGAGRDN
jgi:hypothetical protein